jgi:hypothetical protein
MRKFFDSIIRQKELPEEEENKLWMSFGESPSEEEWDKILASTVQTGRHS